MMTPEPSPTMKPSRSLSNGRLARCGAAFLVDSARRAPNPPMPMGVIAASGPTANCAAPMAYCMRTSIFLTSFFSRKRSGSKPLTSLAIWVANSDASNLVIVPMPLLPALSAAQLTSVPMPSDDTRPMPVMTTRRLLTMLLRAPQVLLLGLGVRLDVLDGFLDARDLLGVLVGNLAPELLLEGHDELDGVERVGTQIVYERGVRRHFLFVDPELLHDDALHLVCYGHAILHLK